MKALDFDVVWLCLAMVVMAQGVKAGWQRCPERENCPIENGPVFVEFERSDCTGKRVFWTFYTNTTHCAPRERPSVQRGGPSTVDFFKDHFVHTSYDNPSCSRSAPDSSWVEETFYYGVCAKIDTYYPTIKPQRKIGNLTTAETFFVLSSMWLHNQTANYTAPQSTQEWSTAYRTDRDHWFFCNRTATPDCPRPYDDKGPADLWTFECENSVAEAEQWVEASMQPMTGDCLRASVRGSIDASLGIYTKQMCGTDGHTHIKHTYYGNACERPYTSVVTREVCSSAARWQIRCGVAVVDTTQPPLAKKKVPYLLIILPSVLGALLILVLLVVLIARRKKKQPENTPVSPPTDQQAST